MSDVPTEKELRILAEQCVAEVSARARELFGPMPLVTVLWRDMGGVAGQAYYRSSEIHLSPHYLTLVGLAKYRETIIHEVAHIVTWQRFKATGHGGEWIVTNAVLGGRDSRCHSYDTTGAPRQTRARARYLRALDNL